MALTQISTDGIKNGTITGSDLATNVDLVDNQKLRLGTGNDLQIWHSSSSHASIIRHFANDSGSFNDLFLDSGRHIKFRSHSSGSSYENMAIFNKDGAVELYHNNSKKFETRSGGVAALGDCHVDSDTGKFLAGLSSDLEMYHNGTHSFIKNNTGTTYLQGPSNLSFIANNKDVIMGVVDAEVRLYYNNSKKFETTSNGIDVEGTVTANDIITAGALLHEGDSDTLVHFSADNTIDLKTGGSSRLTVTNNGLALQNGYFTSNGNRIILGDSSGANVNRIIFGNNDDLQIYHDGSNTIIDNSTGELKIQSDNFRFLSSDGTEYFADFNVNGAVELYHNNNKYFETATNGGIFRGTTWTAVDNCKHTFGTGDDLKIYHDGTDSIIGNETGTLQFLSPNEVRYRATTHHFLSYGNDETMAKFIDDGAVELYQNNDRKLVTIPNGARIESAAGDTYLDVFAEEDAAGVDAYVRIRTEGTTQNCYLMFGDGDDSYIGGLKYEHSGDKLEFIANNAERGSVDSAGLWTFGDGFRLVDDKVGRFGSGDDLKIYHNGTSSYIDNNKNHLYIRNNVNDDDDGNIYIQAKSGENSIVCNDDGAVNIYHNNSLKIGTDAGGVVISGDLDLSQNDLFLNNGTIIATDADGAFANRTGSNIDHLWHNDTDNAWNFCSDTTYRNFGNSTLNCSAIAFGNSSSNVQNDYEEGAWTPTITFGGNSSGQSYDYQIGRYIKIGRLVHIQCYVDLSDKGSSTGTAKLSGLPFTTRNQTGLHPAVQFGWTDSCLSAAGPGGVSDFVAYGEINQTVLNIQRQELSNNGQGVNDATDDNFTDSTQFMLTMTYITN